MITLEEKMRRATIYLFLILGLVLTFTPFFWMFSTSLKSGESIFTFPPQWLPKKPTIEHYQRLFGVESQKVREEKGAINLNFALNFRNSVIVAVACTFVSLFLNSLAAFAFAKFNFPGKEKIFTLLISTLMIPGQVTMIPIFLLLKMLGLLNTFWALIVPGLVSVYGIFLIRQYMLTIPNDLIESARMDGCSDFKIFLYIILPLCKPVLATLAVFSFIGAWNDFLWPLIVTMKESMYTLPVALANLSGEYATDYGLMMAGSVVVVTPIIIVFLFAQKFVIESFATAGLKE